MFKHTLTFVSHTHWDREWYEPFERFRIRLVQMMDKLLRILDTDPDFKYFMLDGQTIVLDDYLAIRPEKEAAIRQYVQQGRVQIGPWHILPDEFLVSPESTIRNLLIGAQTCARFGRRMDVGNIPDPFGHISQLPQILRGFDIDVAVFWRGIGGVANEWLWRSPDGSEVLVIHQHNGYGNAAQMPPDPEAFIRRTRQIVAELAPTATTPHLLAMNGSDHLEPMPELPRLLEAARTALPDVDIRHGTLPQFIADVRAAAPSLETVSGELRQCAAAPLLPGVLSTRMWIKQRNAACETLLTAWAEPLAALVEILDTPMALRRQGALVRQAWRYLLQNHPHDSICGCSIDQVHKEMAVRFDWVEQIGEQMTEQCLDGLAALVDTTSDDQSPSIIVFNPTARPRTDRAQVMVPFGGSEAGLVLVAEDGRIVVPQLGEPERDVLVEMNVPATQLALMVGEIPYEIEGAGIQHVRLHVDGEWLHIEIELGRGLPPRPDVVQRGQAEIQALLAQGHIQQTHIVVHHGERARCSFVAPDVPGCGYRTFWLKSVPAWLEQPVPVEPFIENEFLGLRVADDGTLTLTDKETGVVYDGLNRFVDVGDRGDEYNFCPVDGDMPVQAAADKPLICLIESSPARQMLEISLTYRLPQSLDETHMQRSDEWVELPITSRVSLSPGVRRVDIETTVENTAADHRLRAHFPVPVQVDSFDTENHFDIVSRSLDLPTDTADWVEQPVPTYPQRAWSAVGDGRRGLLVANRGLPEVEALRTAQGSEIALTLLRSVGWLSRDDMSSRHGHAGPGLPTPEAQCIGVHTCHYALIPFAADRQPAMEQAQAWNAPLRAVCASAHGGSLPAASSFVRLEPANLMISAIKEAEQGNGLIVRFWNTDTRPCRAMVRFWQSPVGAARCNLAERNLERLFVAADGHIEMAVGGREVVTLQVEFAAH